MLTISICSFGFQVSGMPEGQPPHQGGFVFDCRGLPNPGREEAYKKLTGLDAEVIEYLECHEEVSEFALHCEALVRQTVESYVNRGFECLSIAFGCTGGQHRSVYQAERLFQSLSKQEGLIVQLKHVEQNSWPEKRLS